MWKRILRGIGRYFKSLASMHTVGFVLWFVFVLLIMPPGTSPLKLFFILVTSGIAIKIIAKEKNPPTRTQGKEDCEDRIEE